MTLIQTIIRSAAPALIMAAMLAATPASAEEKQKVPSKNRAAIVDFASCAKPVWPAAALKAERVGTVTLGFLVDINGTVSDSRVEESSGHDDLDQAARNGIKLCKCLPAIKNGKHSKEWMKMQYQWTLK